MTSHIWAFERPDWLCSTSSLALGTLRRLIWSQRRSTAVINSQMNINWLVLGIVWARARRSQHVTSTIRTHVRRVLCTCTGMYAKFDRGFWMHCTCANYWCHTHHPHVCHDMCTQLRRQARLRREYLYRKSVEDQERTILERKRKIQTAIEGTHVHVH